jgi:DNA-binding transcriptional LysR family regulator
MELRQLRYFVAVAEELHFSRAAARLRMTQPPLSKQIRLLEEDLGAALFFRTRQEVRLTLEGHVFLGRARDLLSQSEEAREAVRRAGNGNVGVLTLVQDPRVPASNS